MRRLRELRASLRDAAKVSDLQLPGFVGEVAVRTRTEVRAQIRLVSVAKVLKRGTAQENLKLMEIIKEDYDRILKEGYCTPWLTPTSQNVPVMANPAPQACKPASPQNQST